MLTARHVRPAGINEVVKRADSARILIADDDAGSRLLLSSRLRHEGFETAEVDDGEKALALLDKEPFDLVLLDIMMPNLDGYATLERLRKKFTAEQLPVIMLTALDAATDVIQALRAGANDYAVKPVDFDQLRTRVQSHLKLKFAKNGRIGKYELLSSIGSGMVGRVYAAQDVTTGTAVALKVLSRSVSIQKGAIDQFVSEAALMTKVQHPNIVRLLESGVDGEIFFLAMELVLGPTLEDAAANDPLSLPVALNIAEGIGLGLMELHHHGVVHRDVKPQNILLSETMQPRIGDFGIALQTDATKRTVAANLGTGSVMYASPQQLLGQPDFRSDMYALGATVFFALTGVAPFDPTLSMSDLFEKKFGPAPSARAVNPNVPAPVDRFVATLMAPAPRLRFVSDKEMMAELSKVRARIL